MPKWLEKAVFYEIYPQSFCDTNADGIGDLPGIIRKLDYIRDLGFNALWINPCFLSPFGDAGYDVADYCHCSVSTISHLFKKQMGQSVPAYILALRLDHAKRLLRETGLAVNQISDALGFCNPNYFCRCFKNSFGVSPSRWRQDTLAC